MILSVLITLIVLLIAYWWANQGLFDAFVHFTCVVIAGVLAFSLWEPITVGFLLHGGGFDAYAWGLCLGLLFLGFLFALRIVFDVFTPKRPILPLWVNLSFGSVLGLLSGILTMGIILIAIGHLSSSRELMGYTGWSRSPESNGRPMQNDPSSPSTFVGAFTQRFFNYLSVGSCTPLVGGSTLASFRPGIAEDAASLNRDSLREGKGNSTLAPKTFTLDGFYFDPKYQLLDSTSFGPGAYAVLLSFQPASFDAGGSFSLSASQSRLIAPTKDGAISEFPVEFSQEKSTDKNRVMTRYAFKSESDFATLESGAAEGKICLVFSAKKFTGVQPTMIMIKGLRIELPKFNADPLQLGLAVENAGAKITITPDDTAPPIPGTELSMGRSLSGMMLNKNDMPGTLLIQDDCISSGAATRVKKNPNAKNDVRQIAQASSEKIVKLKISRDTIVDLFNMDKTRKIAEKVGIAGVPTLVDVNGNFYAPFGYIWVNTNTDEWEFYFESPTDGFTVKQFKRAQNAGYIDVLYRLPTDITICMVILRDPLQPISKAKILGTISLKIS